MTADRTGNGSLGGPGSRRPKHLSWEQGRAVGGHSLADPRELMSVQTMWGAGAGVSQTIGDATRGH